MGQKTGWWNEVHLRLLPGGLYACECGEVLSDVTAYQKIDRNESGYGLKKTIFDPNCCPSCGCTIKGVLVEEESLRGDSDGRDVDSKRAL